MDNANGRLDKLRRAVYIIGAVQTAWCALGEVLSFAYISNSLGVAAGAIAVQRFSTLEKTLNYFQKPYHVGCCGDARQIRSLQIAAIVFAVLDVLSFGAVAATVGVGMSLFIQQSVKYSAGTYIPGYGTLVQDAWCFDVGTAAGVANAYYAGCYPTGFRSVLQWLSAWFIMSAIFPCGNLVLAAVSLCWVEPLFSEGAQYTPAIQRQSSVTVISSGGMGMMQGGFAVTTGAGGTTVSSNPLAIMGGPALQHQQSMMVLPGTPSQQLQQQPQHQAMQWLQLPNGQIMAVPVVAQQQQQGGFQKQLSSGALISSGGSPGLGQAPGVTAQPQYVQQQAVPQQPQQQQSYPQLPPQQAYPSASAGATAPTVALGTNPYLVEQPKTL